MATELLEQSVQQQPRMKNCGFFDCNNKVDMSTLGTSTFRGYVDSFGGIYCCEEHSDEAEH